MKKFVLLSLLFAVSTTFSQAVRNNLFEYATGTWCSSCACSHKEVNEVLAPNFPNTVFIAYHTGSVDPFQNFPGKEIIAGIGFGALPAGIVDRVSTIMPVDGWLDALTDMSNVPSTVELSAVTLFDVSTRTLSVDVTAKALSDMNDNYNVSLVLLEDKLIAAQAGSEFCPGGENFVHNNVARSMLNGAEGEELWAGGTWFTGTELNYNGQYILDEEFIEQNCRVAVIIYKYIIPLQKAHVQQVLSVDVIDGTVPVELSFFNVQHNSFEIVIDWQTASEINNKGFEISRSTDGKLYTLLEFINGQGSSTEKSNYLFIDKSPLAGEFYYKLEQVDFDGSRNTLRIEKISTPGATEYSLSGNYPNPFNPSTTIKFNLPESADVKFSVHNVTGQTVREINYSARPAGQNEIKFESSGLSSGIYFYKISSSFGILFDKMILVK